MPEAAKANTPAGAEAFVRYFNDQVGRAWMTPDTEIIPNLCLSAVAFCQSIQDGAVTLKRDRQHLDRPPTTITSIKSSGAGPSGSLRFEVEGRQVESHVLDAGGLVVSTNSPEDFTAVYYLIWQSGSWKIQDIKAGI